MSTSHVRGAVALLVGSAVTSPSGRFLPCPAWFGGPGPLVCLGAWGSDVRDAQREDGHVVVAVAGVLVGQCLHEVVQGQGGVGGSDG